MNFIMLTLCQTKVRAIKSGTVRWVGYIACVCGVKNVRENLVENPERKRPLGRLRNIFEVKVKLTFWHRSFTFKF
jgi:hypothetical protein